MITSQAKQQYQKLTQFLEYAINSFNLGLPESGRLNVITTMGDFDVNLEYSLARINSDKAFLEDVEDMLSYSNLKKRFDHTPSFEELVLANQDILMLLAILNQQMPNRILFDNLINGLKVFFTTIFGDDKGFEDTLISKALSLGNELTDDVDKMLKDRQIKISDIKDVVKQKLLDKISE